MKVNIKKWNAVATWRWDVDSDDVCGICQVDFDGTCPACKFPGDDCTLCKLAHPGPVLGSQRYSVRKVWSQLSHVLDSIASWSGSNKNRPKASAQCVAKFEWSGPKRESNANTTQEASDIMN
ncbi:hypothetical protein OQA88_1380 [Cercophora sp. LCS_1]